MCRDPFFGVSVSKVSVSSFSSRDFAKVIFYEVLQEFLKKTILKNDCSKFSRSKRSVAELSLLFCCLRGGENNMPSTLFKIYTEFNKKCACTNETGARNLWNERLLRTIFSKSFVIKSIGFLKRGGRVPKSFFFEKPNKTMSFFRSAFRSTLLKQAGEVFLFCVMQTFKVQKCLGTFLRKRFAHKSFIQRANNASWLISYFDVLL